MQRPKQLEWDLPTYDDDCRLYIEHLEQVAKGADEWYQCFRRDRSRDDFVFGAPPEDYGSHFAAVMYQRWRKQQEALIPTVEDVIRDALCDPDATAEDIANVLRAKGLVE